MKKIIVALSISFLISACSSIKDPRMSFGKKCQVTEDNVTYSYIWLYDKKTGLPASKDQCLVLDANK